MTSTTQTLGKSVRDSYDRLNDGDPSGHASHYAEDARVIGPFFPEPLVGRHTIEQTTVAMSNAFPDMRCTIVTMIEHGNRVACEIHLEGTHDGPLPTPSGDVPATGKRVAFDLAAIYDFNEDGFVTELREYMDPGAFMAQLGLME